MAEPILNLILQNLKAAVDTVSAAGPASQTLDAEYREEPYNPATDLKAVVRLGSVEIVDQETSGTSGLVQWKQRFEIIVKVVNTEVADAEPADLAIVRAWSDLHIAVLAETDRGGYAIDSMPEPPQWFSDGFSIEVAVDYRTRRDDPTRQD